MRNHILKTFSIAAAAIALAGSAQAQGKGHEKDRKHDDRHDRDRSVAVHRADGDVIVGPRYRAVPPGLAKKPGQMPPGQYKKRYSTDQGASVLGDIFRRRGYPVDRVVPSGNSRYVYYRTHDGALHRAIVSPGTDRLSFSNVPSSLLQQVLSALY